ncbi:MAG: 50S ribosome-binding GTPase [Thermoplasmata archaeon]|nr:50S ribosome-binding GTPase [Thermoplasmata archaeon]
MYRTIPTVMSADEILDKAFRRASRIRRGGRNPLERERNLTTARISSVGDTVSSVLSRYVSAFPSFNRREGYPESLIDVAVGLDRLKHSLGALDWAAGTVRRIASQTVSSVARERNPRRIIILRKQAYGRISSVVKRVSGELDFLASAREIMRKLPDIDPEKPTVVVAGPPNVGKSMLVSRLSSARPEVASYPFTTKQLHVGHLEYRGMEIQIIDTPGLLDRPLEQRNAAERQAITALRYLAGAIIFLYDPTEECGWPVDRQKALRESIAAEFRGSKMLDVSSKCDRASPLEDTLGVSGLTGQGVEPLLEALRDALEG